MSIKHIIALLGLLLQNALIHTAGNPVPKMIQQADFVEYIVGVNEGLKFDFSTHIKTLGQGGVITDIKNTANGKQFISGAFNPTSIEELQDRLTTQKEPKENSGSFHVIEAVNPEGQPYLRKVDAGALQASPELKDAVFQVASSLNGLELYSRTDGMSGGLSIYVGDYRRGVLASISAAPGLFLRLYGAFYDPKKLSSEWKQTSDQQLDFLDKTGIPVINGFVVLSQPYLDKMPAIDINKIKVGVHSGIQVTFGFMPDTNKFEEVTDPKQIITQVFTAAVDFGKVNSPFAANPTALSIGQTLLEAAYRGTLLAAITSNKKKVVLTPIGYDAFANKFDWIYKALEKSKDLIKDYGLEVYFIIFNSDDFTIRAQMPAFKQQLSDLVGQVANGSDYIQYSPEDPNGKKLVTSPVPVAATGTVTGVIPDTKTPADTATKTPDATPTGDQQDLVRALGALSSRLSNLTEYF